MQLPDSATTLAHIEQTTGDSLVWAGYPCPANYASFEERDEDPF